MEREFGFETRGLRRVLRQLPGQILDGIADLIFYLLIRLPGRILFSLQPSEIKITIKHKYWRRWRNTWRFMRGQYTDGFDPIFNLDGLAMSRMSRRQRERYCMTIARRREYVHQKTLR